MRIYGIDFTSAPRSAKPIACAVCELEDGALSLDCFVELPSLEMFENLLSSAGPWIVGLDFPFGQPRRLVTELDWPPQWDQCVRAVADITVRDFEQMLKAYRDGQAPGDKQHLRVTDMRAGARSPMMLYGVPVGKMFLRGAPRIERSGASVIPCRPNGDDRVVVEAYPALVARRWAQKRSYKNDVQAKQTPARESARNDIVRGIRSESLRNVYGFELKLYDSVAKDLVSEPMADNLDALLCAVQAAWAYTRRDENYGIPKDADPLEGWIVDPATQQTHDPNR